MQSLASNKKILFMVLLGSILEAYDYSLYAYFAPLFAKLFFPSFGPLSGLSLSFAIFAIGFITRPLGSAVFGYFGDKYGRKKMLILSISLMAIPTGLIGALPTYAQIGLYAGLLLAACRLLQGFAVGAEFIGNLVYMIEQAPENRRTFLGSLCLTSGYIATLLTAIVVFLLTHFMQEKTLYAFGWRLPFFFGMLLGFIGLYCRSTLSETPVFKALLESRLTVENPLSQTLSQMPLTLLLGAGIVMVHVLGFYLLFVYMPSYLTTHYSLTSASISSLNIIVLLLAILSILTIGIVAEKLNKKIFIIASALSLIVLSCPMMKLIDHGTFLAVLTALSVLSICLSFTSSVLPAYLADLFPASLRYTGMGLCYNISAVIFGGTAPFVLTTLGKNRPTIMLPGFYLMLAACITLICACFIKNKSSCAQTSAKNFIRPAHMA